MYATDRRTDGRTKATLNAPYPTGGGIINEYACEIEMVVHYKPTGFLRQITANHYLSITIHKSIEQQIGTAEY